MASRLSRPRIASRFSRSAQKQPGYLLMVASHRRICKGDYDESGVQASPILTI